MSGNSHQEQAEAFKDYAFKSKNRGRSALFSIFVDWADSEGISGIDKQEIWKLVRHFQTKKITIIREDSEEFVRLSALLDFLLFHDLAYLNKLIEKNNKNILDNT